jgi:hypothetical protein
MCVFVWFLLYLCCALFLTFALFNYDVNTAVPVQAWYFPRGYNRLSIQGFSDSRQMKETRLSALCTGRLNPPGKILATVLMSWNLIELWLVVNLIQGIRSNTYTWNKPWFWVNRHIRLLSGALASLRSSCIPVKQLGTDTPIFIAYSGKVYWK